MKNLKELRDEFALRCEQSGLPYEVGADGTFFSSIAIVAEAPGRVEVQQKLPLVGGSGGLLWRMLKKHCNLTRKDFYITNVAKRQVAFGHDEERKSIDRYELELWTELLHWELGHLPHVRYVIALGNMALEALTGKHGITDYRGSVLHVDIPDHSSNATRTVQVICLNNPAAVLREPRLETIFAFDVARIKRVLDGSHSPVDITTEMYPSVERIAKYFDECIRTNSIVAVDIENIGKHTACVGFANSPSHALCVSLRDRNNNVYTEKEECEIMRMVQWFAQHPVPKFTMQKGMFDITWLWHFDKIKFKKPWFDTMLAHHVLYPVLPHNLGFLTSQYTDNPFYKNEIHLWKEGSDIETFWDYNGKDCCNTYAATIKLLKELREQGLEKFFFDHVMRLLPHLALMTIGGVKVDMELKEKLRDQLMDTVNGLLAKFHQQCREATGEDKDYNPASPKQMSELYFTKLKLVGRGVKTDAENRDRMYKHPRTSEQARDILSTHNQWAKEHKFFSTYLKTEVDEDGRIRCEYSQTNVQEAPGRLSSSQTLWGSGTNLQNQPVRAYPMYIADDGYMFGYFDLAQAEARYVGWDAEIESWIEQFERARIDGSYDAHRALAAELFKVPYDEVPTYDHYDTSKGHVLPQGKVDGDVTIRYIAKRCRHGLNYRMGPETLAIKAGLPMRVADDAYRLYHRLTPELRPWWQALEHELVQKKALFNSYGRRFILMERKTPEALESIVAFKPQSTIGDKVSRVIYMCHEDDKWPSHCRVALNNHDALIILGREDQIKTALSIAKKHAEEPLYIKGRELIIPADCKLSYPDEKGIHRWSQLKKAEIEKAA